MHTIREWFSRAQAEGFAIGSFNVSSFEMFKAIVAAAVAQRSPVLIESSGGETSYFGDRTLVALVAEARRETGLPIFLNLDHSRTPMAVKSAIAAGYDLVHYDGSKETAQENQRNLKALVGKAHSLHVLVEGELDYIIEGSEKRTISAAQGVAQSQLTDPEKAERFVSATNIDTFAVSIGNVHGLYTSPKKLDIHLLHDIRDRLQCFISLHGGSTISAHQIRSAIAVGRIVKINVSSELRQAYRTGLETALKKSPNEIALYKLLPDAINKVQRIVEEKMQLFGSSHKV